jgi:hypothetical protein
MTIHIDIFGGPLGRCSQAAPAPDAAPRQPGPKTPLPTGCHAALRPETLKQRHTVSRSVSTVRGGTIGGIGVAGMTAPTGEERIRYSLSTIPTSESSDEGLLTVHRQGARRLPDDRLRTRVGCQVILAIYLGLSAVCRGRARPNVNVLFAATPVRLCRIVSQPVLRYEIHSMPPTALRALVLHAQVLLQIGRVDHLAHAVFG